MASNTWDGLSFCNLSIEQASVNGFATIKNAQTGKTDYAFIVEVRWSDERTRFIKRTFSDFLNLQYKLLKCCGNELKAVVVAKKLALLSGRKSMFQRNDSKLAEGREPQLNRFVRQISSLPTQVSQSPLVLSFFESRTTDPKPFKHDSSLHDNQHDDDDDVDYLNGNHDDDDDTDFFIDMTDLMLTEDVDWNMALQPNSPSSSNAIWGSYLDRCPKLLSSSMNDLTIDPFTYTEFAETLSEQEEGVSDTENDSGVQEDTLTESSTSSSLDSISSSSSVNSSS
ncbi:uncharacterized protein LOC106181749 [Lingula anatina]|uniref:Uncharacterized protein LOC106181749 n=1 Tax=Lingula anatina TaxID=7574 RepID=A0A1S3KGT9_LINAN|nr:uncharacterized protein LOC106181749 [Lingula anatina]XP_013421675.1 uncharacterized protein LOC106181749 [Lingula anatina]XP_013421676.1 uncharacterized protein LOC106181749 [Lingula anatina]XP_013421677.1 uncharacterized protein LOC106181749 [Lingula anatina]|eukprot:XP_013421674.1 uncharacterized protein LOC106181749 [Lingula anatina]